VRQARAVELGQRVVAAGYAYGTYRPFFSDGIISDTRARVPGFAASCLQSDTTTPPGTGGGPLLSTRGRLVGINLAFSGKQPGSLVSYAVPIQEVRRVVQALIRGEVPRRGTLGMHVARREGRIIVAGFSEDSPARRAGLQEGDAIVSAEGAPVESEDDIVQLVRAAAPGSAVTLTVERNGKQKSASVTVAQWQPAVAAAHPFELPPGGTFEVTPITPALPDPLPREGKGVHVPVVERPAAGAEVISITGSAEETVMRFRETEYETIEALSAAVGGDPPGSAVVQAEAGVPFGLVQEVIGILTQAGVAEVAIAVKRK
jgi:serine protease Do